MICSICLYEFCYFTQVEKLLQIESNRRLIKLCIDELRVNLSKLYLNLEAALSSTGSGGLLQKRVR